MRAKKFGVTDLSSDAKKIVRAERFGTKNSSSSDTISNKITVVIIYFLIDNNSKIYSFRHPVLMY